MSRSLQIPDNLYSALEAAAQANGTTPVGWIAAHLSLSAESAQAATAPGEAPKTLADLFAGRVGGIQSGGAERLSENCGENFAADLERKRKAGQL